MGKDNNNTFLYVLSHNKAWLITSVILIVLVITVSLVLTQNIFLYGTFNTLFGGERRVLVEGDPDKYQYFTKDTDDFIQYSPEGEIENKDDALAAANALNEEIAEEGFVLLENNGVLPLRTPASPESAGPAVSANPKISIFGKNSVSLVYGGSGSGGGNTENSVGLYDALAAAGYDCNPTLKNFYEDSGASGSGRTDNPAIGQENINLQTGETPQSSYTSEVKGSYAEYGDAAVVVISRIGGEGFDLPRSMKDANGATLSESEEGDHYLELDKNEEALLQSVNENFDDIILIVNCATSMELRFIKDGTYGIDAAIWIASPGGSGINALGSIMNGTVNPSGHTVDTYARDFTKDPTWNNFGNNNVAGGNRYTIGVNGSATSNYFVDYEESIYVGYRYWETQAYMIDYDLIGDADEWYAENVVYPFGYGLSYTTFEWSVANVTPSAGSALDADSTITIEVDVTNTGDMAGKDAVQLYYTAPWRSTNDIEKAYVVLADYAKTPMIQPGETETVTLSVDAYDMASYDYNDANRNTNSGYELSAGTYNLRLGTDAHNSWNDAPVPAINYTVAKTINYDTDPDTGYAVVNRFDDVSSHIETYLSRRNFSGTMTTTPTAEDRAVGTEFINSLAYDQAAYDEKYGTGTYVTTEMPVTGWVAGEGETAHKLYDVIKTNEDGSFAGISDDETIWKNLLDQLTVDEMANLIGTGNFRTNYIESIDKPMTTDPDGPAGFTNFMGDPTVYDTGFYASECVVGATYNKDLAHDMGVMVGIEGLIGNVKGDGRPYSGWYAPAVNIHRSPFSGRNWEYYSEDPVLSGKQGANVVLGAKSKGVYTYIKHFAVNDQETNRDSNGLITWLSEQAMREIYLKPFEIIVKEGKTNAMMSSFNRIGTVWAGGNYELLTEVLRNEWGFEGIVITDYNLQSDGYMSPDQMLRAGGDLNLVQGGLPTVDAGNATQVYLFRRAAKNILYTVAQSNAMNGMGEGNVWSYAMPMWVIVMIIIDVVIVAGLAVWGFFSIRRSLKKRKVSA